MTVMKNPPGRIGARQPSIADQSPERESLPKAARALDVQKNTGWFFRLTPPDEGRDYGNANVWSLPWDIDTLVREAGQNSLDVVFDPAVGVEMEFRLIRLAGTDLEDFKRAIKWNGAPNAPGLYDHLQESAKITQKLGKILRDGLDFITETDELVLLRVDDHHTRGLVGHEFGIGNFAALCRNNLDSSKLSETAGGAYGLGKAVFSRASHFATVLFNSNLSDPMDVGGRNLKEGRLIGRTDLLWHKVGDLTFAGPGWFGLRDQVESDARAVSVWNNRALAHDLYLDRNQDDTGTSILVVGFHDPNSDTRKSVPELADEIARAAARNFWPALVSGRLSVEVATFEAREQKTHVTVQAEDYHRPFVDMLCKFNAGELSKKLANEGDVVQRRIALEIPQRKSPPKHNEIKHEAILLVRQDAENEPDGLTGQVVFYRGRDMIIKSLPLKQIASVAIPFRAAVLCGEAAGKMEADRAAELFLRAAEPPAHTDWMMTPELKAEYAPGSRKTILKFFEDVKEEIRKFMRPRYDDLNDGPNALKELLQISGSPFPPPTGPTLEVDSSSHVDSAGRWIINGTVKVPNDKAWSLKPVLVFASETGSGRRVSWTLESISGCSVLGEELIVPAGTRQAEFRGISTLTSYTVDAQQVAVTVVLKDARERG